MRWQTHVLFGISALWILSPLPQEWITANYGILSACAACGALLPDLDASESKIKHLKLYNIEPLALPALALHQALGHRGLLHSLWGLGLAATLTIPLAFYCDWTYWTAVDLGYASHLTADACTKSGIPLLYPKPTRYHLLPRFLRVTTGSLAEDMLFPLLATAVLVLLLTQLSSLSA